MVNMTNPQYQGFWIRLLAYILDILILGIPLGIISGIIGFVTKMTSLQYLLNIAYLALYIWFEGVKGGTPGKLILGMRIVNEKGEYIGIPMAILRYVGKILSAVIIFIGYIMIGFDAKKQGLHDKIAKTYVVKV